VVVVKIRDAGRTWKIRKQLTLSKGEGVRKEVALGMRRKNKRQNI